MHIKANKLQKGYNSILTRESAPSMEMDFGIQVLENGEKAVRTAPGECVFSLLKGKVTFIWNGHEETAERVDMFRVDPVVLHVPAGQDVTMLGGMEGTEVAIVSTPNTRNFAPALLRKENLLSASELRGEGLMNDASTRIVRTYLDRSNKPETNFFLGEVVSLPGKWSSYPPHTHVTPEFYYYRFLPENGFGFSLHGADDAFVARNGDTGCFPDGMLHSQTTAPGYAEWYLWVIRLRDNEPMETVEIEEHVWARAKDAKFFPDI